MALPEVFEFLDYKRYLLDRIEALGPQGHGERSRMAKAASCQVAYVSQVLGGPAHLSPEQGADLSAYLGHTKEEMEYFLLLIGLARAGTSRLRAQYREQVERIRERRRHLAERLELKARLSREDEATYYSAWYFAAIHTALAVPGLGSVEALSRYFGLPPALVSSVVDYLVTRGLAVQSKGGLRAGHTGLHLPAHSPLVAQHHTNWRLRAVDSLGFPSQADLHYSSVAAFAREDKEKVHEILVKAIGKVRACIRESPDEELSCYAIDLFSLGRNRPDYS